MTYVGSPVSWNNCSISIPALEEKFKYFSIFPHSRDLPFQPLPPVHNTIFGMSSIFPSRRSSICEAFTRLMDSHHCHQLPRAPSFQMLCSLLGTVTSSNSSDESDYRQTYQCPSSGSETLKNASQTCIVLRSSRVFK